MREPTTKTKVYYLLRWWRPKDNKVCYAYDSSLGRSRREWGTTDMLRQAYKFDRRADARQVVRSKAFEDLRLGPRRLWRDPNRGYAAYKRFTEEAYFWEVVKVTETIVTSFEEEIFKSNAPAMVQLARAVL